MVDLCVALFAAPAHSTLHSTTKNSCNHGGYDHVTFQSLVNALDNRLRLPSTLAHLHQSLLPGITLVRVADSNVQTLEEVRSMHLKSRRVWVGLSDSTTPHRKLDDDDAFDAWSQLLVSTFHRQCALQLGFYCKLRRALWPPKMLQALGVQPFSMMAQQCGFNFKYTWRRLRLSGLGLGTTCRSISRHGNYLPNLHCPFVSKRPCPRQGGLWLAIRQQTTVQLMRPLPRAFR